MHADIPPEQSAPRGMEVVLKSTRPITARGAAWDHAYGCASGFEGKDYKVTLEKILQEKK